MVLKEAYVTQIVLGQSIRQQRGSDAEHAAPFPDGARVQWMLLRPLCQLYSPSAQIVDLKAKGHELMQQVVIKLQIVDQS